MTSRWRLAALAVALIASPAWANPGQLIVEDQAKLFSPEGIATATEAFRATEFRAETQFTLLTLPETPPAIQERLKTAGSDSARKSSVYREWAEREATQRKAQGLFVLVSLKPGHVQAIDDRRNDVTRDFGNAKLTALSKTFIDAFQTALKETDPARQVAARDAGLMRAVDYVSAELENTGTEAAPAKGTDALAAAAGADPLQMNIAKWLCIGLVGLLVMWVVIGIIRSLTSRPQYGPGGAGGGSGAPGYGGGGGGGFMPGLFGGMLGGAAGAWMYNSMFGGGSSAMSPGGGYTDTGANAPLDDGAGDFAGGGSAGGDFGGYDDDMHRNDFGGGDFGGGDFGDGGGDFGGGDF